MVSRTRERKTLYILMIWMLAVHGTILTQNLTSQVPEIKLSVSESIKVKLIAETPSNKRSDKKQIVRSEDSSSKDKPKNQAFLSDKDRSFERETVSKNNGIFNKAAKGNSDHNLEAKKTKQKDIKLSDIGMNRQERAEIAKATEGMDNGDEFSKGLSSTNDYVEEMRTGDFTYLNTVEYKYFGFYHRIRQKLEQFWGRSIHEKANALFRSGRRIPAGQDLITSLQIGLNAKGEIISVKILGASGVKELDDAAIESFNQAGPFPNPPKELLVNGEAVIEWGFVVKS